MYKYIISIITSKIISYNLCNTGNIMISFFIYVSIVFSLSMFANFNLENVLQSFLKEMIIEDLTQIIVICEVLQFDLKIVLSEQNESQKNYFCTHFQFNRLPLATYHNMGAVVTTPFTIALTIFPTKSLGKKNVLNNRIVLY